ncbi:hypothetical protein SAMN04487946_10915 [Halobellus clavatus]|uniref:Uncharacterized protein n=1 Tax=Halobellus clavatus TaxID=660517 RepID=A0A1H3I624_9EURY|nr:hypothetical protein SAMN04487946_10915 [Halobellus clavatus]
MVEYLFGSFRIDLDITDVLTAVQAWRYDLGEQVCVNSID